MRRARCVEHHISSSYNGHRPLRRQPETGQQNLTADIIRSAPENSVCAFDQRSSDWFIDYKREPVGCTLS